MSMICKYGEDKQITVGFSDADSCNSINNENVYSIILMSEGSLTLRVNGRRVKGFAPCAWIFKENVDVKYASSQKLSARSICFNMKFLYRSATFEMVNSGEYEKLMDSLDLIPLNVFYDKSEAFSYVLPLSEAEFERADSYFDGFVSAVLNQSYRRWSCKARHNLNGLLELLNQEYIDFINQDKLNANAKNPQVWVQTIIKKIHTNYPDGALMSLAPLSREIGINKDTVSKKFKELLGAPLVNILLIIVLSAHAIHLLILRLPLKKSHTNADLEASSILLDSSKKEKKCHQPSFVKERYSSGKYQCKASLADYKEQIALPFCSYYN